MEITYSISNVITGKVRGIKLCSCACWLHAVLAFSCYLLKGWYDEKFVYWKVSVVLKWVCRSKILRVERRGPLKTSVSRNKKRVEPKTGLSFFDSLHQTNHTCTSEKLKIYIYRRKSLQGYLATNTRAHNEIFIINLSNQSLSNNKVKLLSRNLKFIPSKSYLK